MMQSSLDTNAIENARKIFSSLGNYKDSASLAVQSQNKRGGAKQAKIALISLGLASFCGVVSGLSIGSGPFFIVFAMAFVISFGYLQFKVK